MGRVFGVGVGGSRFAAAAAVVVVAAVMLAAVMLAAPPPAAGAQAEAGSGVSGLCDSSGVAQFDDVGSGDYGADYILCMRALGLSLGVGDDNYGPDRKTHSGSDGPHSWCDCGVNSVWPVRAAPRPSPDVAGGYHQENIACLYNLGITKGTSATTYGPGSDLTFSQISLFLARTYEKAGNSL